MYADENVIKIKHAVLLEVAKAAFAGNLDEIRDDIPFTLIPGPTPQFRDVYKRQALHRQGMSCRLHDQSRLHRYLSRLRQHSGNFLLYSPGMIQAVRCRCVSRYLCQSLGLWR